MMRKPVGCILLAGMMLALLPSVLRADSNVADPGALFPIVQDAQGVEVHGQLAIYYDVIDNPLLPPDFTAFKCAIDHVNMFFVLRLRKGDNAPAGFAGSVREVCYEDQATQIGAVLQFMVDPVIPFLFPNAGSPTINLPGQPCPRRVPCLSLTAVKRIVQDGEAQFAPPYFFLMNVEFRFKR